MGKVCSHDSVHAHVVSESDEPFMLILCRRRVTLDVGRDGRTIVHILKSDNIPSHRTIGDIIFPIIFNGSRWNWGEEDSGEVRFEILRDTASEQLVELLNGIFSWQAAAKDNIQPIMFFLDINIPWPKKINPEEFDGFLSRIYESFPQLNPTHTDATKAVPASQSRGLLELFRKLFGN